MFLRYFFNSLTAHLLRHALSCYVFLSHLRFSKLLAKSLALLALLATARLDESATTWLPIIFLTKIWHNSYVIGERIKELRQEKNLSQTQLAEMLTCSQRNVSSYEHNLVDLPASVIIKLCHIFQISADYLLGLEDETGAKKYR